MKRIINAVMLLAAVLWTSCYEDKGNYDYNQLTEVQISGIEDKYTVYVGSDMKIPVEITYKNGILKDVSYEWRING